MKGVKLLQPNGKRLSKLADKVKMMMMMMLYLTNKH